MKERFKSEMSTSSNFEINTSKNLHIMRNIGNQEMPMKKKMTHIDSKDWTILLQSGSRKPSYSALTSEQFAGANSTTSNYCRFTFTTQKKVQNQLFLNLRSISGWLCSPATNFDRLWFPKVGYSIWLPEPKMRLNIIWWIARVWTAIGIKAQKKAGGTVLDTWLIKLSMLALACSSADCTVENAVKFPWI